MIKREIVSLKLVLLLDNLFPNQQNFTLNLGWGNSEPKRAKGVRVIKREKERESESRAEHNCVNNRMVF